MSAQKQQNSTRQIIAQRNRLRRDQVQRNRPTAELVQVAVGSTTSPTEASSTAPLDARAQESATKVLKYLDDYRSANDTKALRDEGYEIDYDRLVGVGANSAVFLAHSINAPPPALDKNGQRPLYTPGYDIAVKVVAKKWISDKRPLKTRTGNLKLALALGQTKPENNILKVIDVFKTPERIFVFMQYCAYGNVISFIRRNGQVPSKLARKWSSQMAMALAFLHKFHVAHRNYKLENVLIDENLDAKLTGFGLSKFCFDLQTKQTIMSRTICGSEPYLAPEMLREANERVYDAKMADVWAFGVGIFLCLASKYPFEAENLRALKAEQMLRRHFDKDPRKRIRGSVRQMLSLIFAIDPKHRPTMQELCDQVEWLQATKSNTKKPDKEKAAASPLQGNIRKRLAQPINPTTPRTTESSSVSRAQQRMQPQASQAVPEETQSESLNPVVPIAYQANKVLPQNTEM